MKIFKFSLFGISTAMLCLAACGDDVTHVTKETSGLDVVASADSLGKCTEDRFGEMKFAEKEGSVFVCADSTWQDVSDEGKASCSTELLADSSGYKIVCGGDSVGVVSNGKDGKKGEVGNSCTISKIAKSESFAVVCGSDTVGTLQNGLDGKGCSTTDNGDGSFTQVCGQDTVTLYKAICGDSYYDPDYQLCYADSVYSFCNGKFYSPAETFCFEDSLYALCDGNSYDPRSENCENRIVYGSATDTRDSQVYKTVRVGSQTWMAENLNFAYLQKTATEDSSSFCYDNDSANCEKYGRLYLWSAAMDSAALFTESGKGCGYGVNCTPKYPVRGVCMEGWHLPDSTEWSALTNFVAEKIGGADSVGYALKSTSDWKDGWRTSGIGSNAFGFRVLPAGYRSYYKASFNNILESSYFWNATKDGNSDAYILSFSYDIEAYKYSSQKDNAYSVRCIKDEE